MRIWVLVVLLFLIAILVAQNTDVVSMRLLFWEVYLSRVVLILLPLAVGIVIGFAAAKLPRRRSKNIPPVAPTVRLPER